MLYEQLPECGKSELWALADAGKFASAPLFIPDYTYKEGWQFFLNGDRYDGYIVEIYAPGDDTGWATVYRKSSEEPKLVLGNWSMSFNGNGAE